MSSISSFLQVLKRRFLKTFLLIAIAALAQPSLAANTLLLVTGPGARHSPIVRITVNTGSGNDTIEIQAYRNGFLGGVRVAAGDVNGDSVPDIITGPGPGMGARIRVFDGLNGRHMASFLAYQGFFRGGVFVAAGDVNGDGKADIIVGPDQGAPPFVRVFDGNTGNAIRGFLAYSPLFMGGVRVAAGDVNGDGVADIITGAGPGGAPHVKVFDGNNLNLLQSFFAYDANFLGGVYVGAGFVNADAHADVITGAGPGAGPHVKVFDGANLVVLRSFFAFDLTFTGGVRVAADDVNGDGLSDIVTGAGPGGGPHVKVFDSQSLNVLHSFFAYEPNFTGGVFVGGIVNRISQRN